MRDLPSDWKPRSIREGLAPDTDSLAEGVPRWLFKSLGDWVESFVKWYSRRGSGMGHDTNYNTSLLQEIERRLRVQLDWSYPAGPTALKSLRLLAESNGEFYLDLIDFLLAGHTNETSKIERLDAFLREGGSAWHVRLRDGQPQLERRVKEEVAIAAEHVMGSDSKSAAFLRRAWTHTYGRSPNASVAYQDSVRAVEAAAIPIVSPKNHRATLGTVIRDVRASAETWTLSIDTPSGFNEIEAVLWMMELLWKGQHDRHGNPSEERVAVTEVAGEAALHLAVTLVHWFERGVVQRKTCVPAGAI